MSVVLPLPRNPVNTETGIGEVEVVDTVGGVIVVLLLDDMMIHELLYGDYLRDFKSTLLVYEKKQD